MCGPTIPHQTEDDEPVTFRTAQPVNGVRGFGSLVLLLVDVDAQGVHSQPQVCALLVLDVKVIDAVHFQVLGDFQVFSHGLFPGQTQMQPCQDFYLI